MDDASLPTSLADDVRGYLNYIQTERGLCVNSAKCYRRALGHWQRYLAGGGCADYLAPQAAELTGFLEYMAGPADLGPASAAMCVSALRLFYRWLVLEERTTLKVIRAVENLERPKQWDRLPMVLSLENVKALIEAPRPSDRYFLRDRAIMEFLYATACRASECCDQKLIDVHLSEGNAVVDGKRQKKRMVLLGRLAIEALRDYLDQLRPRMVRRAPGSPWLFVARGGRRLTREMVWVLVKRNARRAGLPESVAERVSPHTLRHSCASHLLQGGCDLLYIAELLGHSRLTTTQGYTRVDLRHLRKIHALLFPPPSSVPPIPVGIEVPDSYPFAPPQGDFVRGAGPAERLQPAPSRI